MKKVLVSLLGLGLVATGCSAGGTERPGEPGTTQEIQVAMPYEPLGLDPITIVGAADRLAALAVFETLADMNEEGDLVPGLAVSWESEDAKTWVVTLREGVEFSDGAPFDGEAVVANYERTRDPERNPNAAQVPAFTSIK